MSSLEEQSRPETQQETFKGLYQNEFIGGAIETNKTHSPQHNPPYQNEFIGGAIETETWIELVHGEFSYQNEFIGGAIETVAPGVNQFMRYQNEFIGGAIETGIVEVVAIVRYQNEFIGGAIETNDSPADG